MAGSRYPSRSMDVESHVVVSAEHAIAGVEPDTDADATLLRPAVRRHRPDHPDRGPQCRRRVDEHAEERIALGGDFDPALGGNRLAYESRMLAKHGGPIGTEIRRQAGRAFDVADEKGDGPGWKLHHVEGSRYRAGRVAGTDWPMESP